MSFALGLTGSIGMGKTTTAQMLADEGCEVWDADAAVHRLYGEGGAAVAPLAALFPDAVREGCVDRGQLKRIIDQTPEALTRIEKVVHPLVAADREAFRSSATSDILVFDIPLLFETGAESWLDAVAVVSVSPEIQEERVLARGTMSIAQFQHIRSRQMADADKRAKADYVILTDTLDHARDQVRAMVRDIRSRINHA